MIHRRYPAKGHRCRKPTPSRLTDPHAHRSGSGGLTNAAGCHGSLTSPVFGFNQGFIYMSREARQFRGAIQSIGSVSFSADNALT
jgi:hypothetical protein